MDKPWPAEAATQGESTVAASRNNITVALSLSLLPWPAVAFGLYALHRVWAAFALYHAVCFAGWVYARAPLPKISEFLARLRRRHWAALGAGCLLLNAAVYFSAGYFASLLAPHHLSGVLNRLGVGDSLLDRSVLFAYFGLVNPVVEELFWRQTIYARLRAGRWTPRWSSLVSGALFGAWHWLPIHLLLPQIVVWPAVIGVALTGALFALLYERLRSLRVVTLLHALGADIPILVALWVDVLSRR